MAYQTYTTEAVICGSRHHNTSDKSYLLFGRELGMVWATARSVREERSRQRYALQDFSVVRVSLVRGKSGWRIGSVTTTYNIFSAAPSREVRGAMVRMVKLLRQFVHGEESHPALYEDFTHAARALCASGSGSATAISDVFALRLLHKLGYVAAEDSFQMLLEGEAWTTYTDPLPASAQRAIENAQQVSHL